MTGAPESRLIVGVLGELDELLREAVDERQVHVRALPADGGDSYRDELLRRSDAVVMRLADHLGAWACLTGALNGLIAGNLLSVYVIAEDVAAVEAFLDATSGWGEDASAVRSFREDGRLRIIQEDDFAPGDLRAQLEAVVSSAPASG